MKKLVIKKPGLFINIPGMTSFRTPAKVDISKVDIKMIISCLNRYGIKEYEIEDEENIIKKEVIEEKEICNSNEDNEKSNNLLSKFLNPNFKISEI